MGYFKTGRESTFNGAPTQRILSQHTDFPWISDTLGTLLDVTNCKDFNINVVKGKVLYKCIVKVIHKHQLKPLLFTLAGIFIAFNECFVVSSRSKSKE